MIALLIVGYLAVGFVCMTLHIIYSRGSLGPGPGAVMILWPIWILIGIIIGMVDAVEFVFKLLFNRYIKWLRSKRNK